MATLRTVTVDTDDIGSPDYTDLATAESTEQGDISLSSGTDEYVEFECTGATDDTVIVIVNGWITEEANYVHVLTPQASRHVGVLDDSKYTSRVFLDMTLYFFSSISFIPGLGIAPIALRRTLTSSTGSSLEE